MTIRSPYFGLGEKEVPQRLLDLGINLIECREACFHYDTHLKGCSYTNEDF